MQTKPNLSDTQPRRLPGKKTPPRLTPKGKFQLKSLLTPRNLFFFGLGLGVVAFGVLFGGWLGYATGQQTRQSLQSEQALQSLDSQFQLAVQDMEAGRYEVARHRLEFIVSQNPDYPGITEKLATVLEVLYATGTPAPAATITATPTPDLRPVQDLYNQALKLASENQWSTLIDTLGSLRKADLNYQIARVDGLLYLALRSRGIQKILNEGNLGGGSYDLALAEHFGPLDVDAASAREWARLYMIGLSFWEVYPDQSVYYLSQVAAVAPNLRDGSGWTAMERYYQALILYGDALAKKKAWCEAASQYELALSIRAEAGLQETYKNALLECQGPTETPTLTETPLTGETPTATFIPGPETPTPTEAVQAPTATATQTAPPPPPATVTPTFTPTPTEPPLTTTEAPGEGNSQNSTGSLLPFFIIGLVGLSSLRRNGGIS